MGDIREPLRELTECGLPQALEVMGERWAFMILRASFNGLHHFEEFLTELGIARNILSNRLTDKGFDLLPAMIALRQWGQKYGTEIREDPVLVDARDRLPLGPVSILSHDGRTLAHEDLWLTPRDKLGIREDGSCAEAGKCCHPGARDEPIKDWRADREDAVAAE